MSKVAVVTGALKGLGREAAETLLKQGFKVAIAGRDEIRGHAVERELRELGDVKFFSLDVSNPLSIESFVQSVTRAYDSIDVLINNAGIFPDRDTARSSEELTQMMTSAFTTNAVGPYLLIEKILPTMQRQKHGRIVNVSSGMGQLSHMGTGSPAYRMSKVALNGVTRFFYATLRDSDILINSVCPGWVKTDMGGDGAPRTLEQGASGIVWAATLPKGGPNGGFFRDGKALEF